MTNEDIMSEIESSWRVSRIWSGETGLESAAPEIHDMLLSQSIGELSKQVPKFRDAEPLRYAEYPYDQKLLGAYIHHFTSLLNESVQGVKEVSFHQGSAYGLLYYLSGQHMWSEILLVELGEQKCQVVREFLKVFSTSAIIGSLTSEELSLWDTTKQVWEIE